MTLSDNIDGLVYLSVFPPMDDIMHQQDNILKEQVSQEIVDYGEDLKFHYMGQILAAKDLVENEILRVVY